MSGEILSAIKDALKSTLNLNEETQILQNTKLKEDLGLDSMSTLTFLIALEESIDGFIVDPDLLDIGDLETVASVENYVKSVMFEELSVS